MISEHAHTVDEPVSARQCEAERVLDWRISQLAQAGYEGEAVLRLATSPEVDLRLAIDLVRRGCPPGTALRILL
jgi:hypothetical protein